VVFGELGNFPLWGVDLGHYDGWSQMVFGELGNFPLGGVDLGHYVGWSQVVFGELGNFPLWGLIWGTVWMVLGGFWRVTQFSFMGVDLGHCVDGLRWFLGS
jgi:hypothetical protein